MKLVFLAMILALAGVVHADDGGGGGFRNGGPTLMDDGQGSFRGGGPT